MNPRPYQLKAVESTLEGFRQFNRQLGILPTGGGKTLVFSWIAQKLLPRRTLILAHREELLTQAADKLRQATGIHAEIEKAEHRASFNAQVVVGSIQSMQGDRLQRWPQDHFGLVVVDEAHHSMADTYRRTLNHFDSSAWVLGVTATPDRSDRKNLGEYYENIAFEVSLFDLINQGYLSRIAVKSVPIRIDLSGVRQTAGDYNESDLGDALNPYLRQIARAVRDEAGFRRTLVFLPLIATSQKFVEIANEEGLRAAHVDGQSPDRREILQRYSAGEFDVLGNAMLLTEGYDDPGIDCLVILRPTKSRALYSQMVGRGTRIAPGKNELMLLDPIYIHEKHNLIRPAHLIARNDAQADIITELVERKSGGGTQELLDLQGLVSEAQAIREQRLRDELSKKSKRNVKNVDAMEWCMAMDRSDLCDYEPAMKWESEPMTQPQARALKRAGIDLATVGGKGHASKLLSVFFEQQRKQPASDRQRRQMQRAGHPDWENATAEQARKFFASMHKEAA